MKRFITIIMSLAMVLLVAACGGNETTPESAGSTAEAPTVEEPAQNDSADLAADPAEPVEDDAEEDDNIPAVVEETVDGWIPISAHSVEAQDSIPAYVRLLNVTDDASIVQSFIDDYTGIFDISSPQEGLKFVIIEYETMFPEGSVISEVGQSAGVRVYISALNDLQRTLRWQGTTLITSSVTIVTPPAPAAGEVSRFVDIIQVFEDMPLEEMAVRIACRDEENTFVNLDGDIIQRGL